MLNNSVISNKSVQGTSRDSSSCSSSCCCCCSRDGRVDGQRASGFPPAPRVGAKRPARISGTHAPGREGSPGLPPPTSPRRPAPAGAAPPPETDARSLSLSPTRRRGRRRRGSRGTGAARGGDARIRSPGLSSASARGACALAAAPCGPVAPAINRSARPRPFRRPRHAHKAGPALGTPTRVPRPRPAPRAISRLSGLAEPSVFPRGFDAVG